MSLIEQALRRIKDPIIAKDLSGPPAASAAQHSPSTSHKTPSVAHSWTTTPTAPSPVDPLGTPATVQQTTPTVIVVGLICALTLLLIIGGTQWTHRTLSEPPTAAVVESSPTPEPAAVADDPAPSDPAPVLTPVAMPTVPPTAELSLTGVVAGAGEAYAVINGLIVTIGDTVDGWTLSRITAQSVTLHKRDEERTLRVPRS